MRSDKAVTATRSARWRTIALAVVIVLGIGYGGWALIQHQRIDVARAQALSAAEKYALTLSNVNSGIVDDTFDELTAGSTGEFRAQQANSRDHLRGMIQGHIATTRGTIVDSAVKSATPDRVVVMVLVDQSVRNAANLDPFVDHSRIRMTMQKIDGQWLASKVELL